MKKRKKSKLDTWAPSFGLWQETELMNPPAATKFLAMWQAEGAAVELGHLCCYYYDDADGKKVDPEQEPDRWVSIRYWQLRGEKFVEMPTPDLWCETR